MKRVEGEEINPQEEIILGCLAGMPFILERFVTKPERLEMMVVMFIIGVGYKIWEVKNGNAEEGISQEFKWD